ncbi:MAG TPA: DUF4838 domain-containing protein [Chthoniobacteraceae bacterium]|nr:DUF4838 domain-containing protein [Chthoniobacteraceae bacterium]
MKPLICLFFLLPTVFLSAADLVVDGKPVSEIIVREEALPQVRFAARELQEHLRKMSGAQVPIVHAPSGREGVYPVYVGEQEATRRLGVSLEKLPMEGYRIVAGDRALVLAGKDFSFGALPPGFKSTDDVPRLTGEWQKLTGRKWSLPYNGLYNPRNLSPELGFSHYDPTGTLFAVYDFLEQLGVRWYYPDTATGTVIPEQRTIAIETQEREASPVFPVRYMRYTFPASDLEGFLWWKRQKLGMAKIFWHAHGTPFVSRVTPQTPNPNPEFFAVVNGETPFGKIKAAHGGGTRRTPAPRLAAPLRDEMIDFADEFFKRYPMVDNASAAPADGFVSIDDRDAAAGWDRKERGDRGRFSDYIWNFVNEVAQGVAKKHPDKFITGLAYGYGRAVPLDIDRFSPNLGVVYCQTRSTEMIDPARREEIRKERNDWIAKMGNGEFYIWEYYLSHEPRRQLPGVPAIFTRIMQEDAQDLRGKSKGEYVECSYGRDQMQNPGLNHYPYLVQARLYWDPDLDLPAFLDEYCRKFYGPAAEEMKAFFTHAEKVWMQPGGRKASDENFFLKEADIQRFFEILEAAKTKAGEGLYGKRVAIVANECEPMRGIYGAKEAYEKGVAAAKAGDGEAAARHLETAVRLAHDPAALLEAQVALGEVYRDQRGDNAAAIAIFGEAAKGGGNKVAVPWRRLARKARYAALDLLLKEKRYDEASQLLDQIEPDREKGLWKFRLLKAYGDIARAQGDIAAAQERYAAAMEVKNVPEGEIRKLRKELDQ